MSKTNVNKRTAIAVAISYLAFVVCVYVVFMILSIITPDLYGYLMLNDSILFAIILLIFVCSGSFMLVIYFLSKKAQIKWL